MEDSQKKNTDPEFTNSGTPNTTDDTTNVSESAESAPGSTPAGTTPTTDTSTMNAADTPEPSNTMALVLGAIVVALLLIAGAWFVMNDDDRSVATPDTPAVGTGTDAFETGDPEEVVAVVNGTDLTRGDFNQIRQQVIQSAQQQGMSLDDPQTVAQINAQASQTLVNTELIRQAAVAAGVTVSDEDVDVRFAEIIDQVGGEEALQQSLTELGLTEDELRGDVEQELVVQAYLDDAITTDFSASDEEIQAFYDQAGGADGGLPPLEEVRDQIEQQLVATQEQEAIQGLLDELRAEADVETMIDTEPPATAAPAPEAGGDAEAEAETAEPQNVPMGQ